MKPATNQQSDTDILQTGPSALTNDDPRGKRIDVVEEPPRGVMPRKLADEGRLSALRGAIWRYLSASKEIPLEWVHEYNEIAYRLKCAGEKLY